MPQIAIGDTAPEFQAETWEGKPVRLEESQGKKLWLAFFRYASCPLCNLQVKKMRDKHAEFQEKGLEILAVFQSPKAKMAKHVGSQRPEFPLVADPSQSLYELYGVGSDLKGMLNPMLMGKLAKAMSAGFIPATPDGVVSRIPADFLIDENGIVRDRFDGKDIGDHIPFERVEAFLG